VLSKPNRLKKSNDFRKVLNRGKKTSEGLIVLKWMPNGLAKSRFGFIISKKVSKKSVIRNQIRRKLQASVKNIFPLLKKEIDAVIIVGAGTTIKENFSQLLKKIFIKTKLLKEE